MQTFQKCFELKCRLVFIFVFIKLILLTENAVMGQNVIFSNPITGTNPNTDNPYTTGQIFIENITVTGIGRGTGINGTDANNRYNANHWNTNSFGEDVYFSFTLMPNSGYEINFETFFYTSQTSGTGPTNFSFRSSIDDFNSDIGTSSATGSTIDLTTVSFQNIRATVEFRLYAWGASSASGTFSINDFSFIGNVLATGCSVPDAAGTITGTAMVTPYQKGVVYSISSITNATGYAWNLPTGATIVSGINTNSITVDFGSESGNIRVCGTNDCGNGTRSPDHLVTVGYPEIYIHDFGTTEISTYPYTDPPGTLTPHLTNIGWTNSLEEWESYEGSTGEAIALENSSGSPTITLILTIDPAYQLKITHYNFWRKRSNTGAQNWELTINGIAIGSGTIPTAGNFIDKTAVTSEISHLTGTITIVLALSGASGSGTFRLDDFTLYGEVANICEDESPVLIITNPEPVCYPSTVNLTDEKITSGSTSGLSFTYWNNEETTSEINEPSAISNSGTYYLKGTSDAGCYAIQPVPVNIYQIGASITPPEETIICPQSEPSQGFDSNNATFNYGTTKLKFNVERENSNSCWSFLYKVSGGAVNTSFAPFYPSTGTISLAEGIDEFEMIFYIDNTTISAQNIVFEVSKVTDTEYDCTLDYTANKVSIIIRKMPVIGVISYY